MAEKKKIDDLVFSKSQILKSKTFEHRQDFLNGVLDENKKYTKNEVIEILKGANLWL